MTVAVTIAAVWVTDCGWVLESGCGGAMQPSFPLRWEVGDLWERLVADEDGACIVCRQELDVCFMIDGSRCPNELHRIWDDTSRYLVY